MTDPTIPNDLPAERRKQLQVILRREMQASRNGVPAGVKITRFGHAVSGPAPDLMRNAKNLAHDSSGRFTPSKKTKP